MGAKGIFLYYNFTTARTGLCWLRGDLPGELLASDDKINDESNKNAEKNQ